MNATAHDFLITPRSHQELISQRAREIWNARGRPDGQDLAIWIDAERDLVRRRLIPARDTQQEAASIDTDKVMDRLNHFGDSAARATSLDLTSRAPSTQI